MDIINLNINNDTNNILQQLLCSNNFKPDNLTLEKLDNITWISEHINNAIISKRFEYWTDISIGNLIYILNFYNNNNDINNKCKLLLIEYINYLKQKKIISID